LGEKDVLYGAVYGHTFRYTLSLFPTFGVFTGLSMGHLYSCSKNDLFPDSNFQNFSCLWKFLKRSLCYISVDNKFGQIDFEAYFKGWKYLIRIEKST